MIGWDEASLWKHHLGGVDIRCFVVERDKCGIVDEDVSKLFETPAELVSTEIEILDGVIENLSQESNKAG